MKKIIETILWSMFCLLIFEIFISFVYGIITLDDDIMFFYGFVLIALTCFTVMLIIISNAISSIWEKKKF